MAKKKPRASQINTKNKAGKTNRSLVKTGIMVFAGILVLAGAFYTVSVYKNSEQEQTGFFVCDKSGNVCEISQHIHADITLTACGEKIIFPKEKGRVDLQHTHKETNKLHRHMRVQVDPVTKEPLDPAPLMVKAFLDQMEYTFPASCPTNPAPEITATINDKQVDNVLQYIWKDNDKIVIGYE